MWMIPFSFFGIWVNGGAGVSMSEMSAASSLWHWLFAAKASRPSLLSISPSAWRPPVKAMELFPPLVVGRAREREPPRGAARLA